MYKALSLFCTLLLSAVDFTQAHRRLLGKDGKGIFTRIREAAPSISFPKCGCLTGSRTGRRGRSENHTSSDSIPLVGRSTAEAIAEEELLSESPQLAEIIGRRAVEVDEENVAALAGAESEEMGRRGDVEVEEASVAALAGAELEEMRERGDVGGDEAIQGAQLAEISGQIRRAVKVEEENVAALAGAESEEMRERGDVGGDETNGRSDATRDERHERGRIMQKDYEKRKEKFERGDAKWVEDDDVTHCISCRKEFTFTRRRHHCRYCGKVFCSVCLGKKSTVGELKERVCGGCLQKHEEMKKALVDLQEQMKIEDEAQ